MKPFTEAAIIWFLFVSSVFVILMILEHTQTEERLRTEKQQLEIQHLKYQVGIDSLRYDLELNFYERRKAK